MLKYTSVMELTHAGKYWQRQLRMEDWDIAYYLRRHFEMPHKDADGNSLTMSSLKKAYIYLLVKDDHEYHDGYDMEQVLVHELLHLPFDSFMDSKDGKHYLHQEQFIDAMAWSLVRLNRGIKR